MYAYIYHWNLVVLGKIYCYKPLSSPTIFVDVFKHVFLRNIRYILEHYFWSHICIIMRSWRFHYIIFELDVMILNLCQFNWQRFENITSSSKLMKWNLRLLIWYKCDSKSRAPKYTLCSWEYMLKYVNKIVGELIGLWQ